MPEPIHVGIVGANATRGSWGSRAHILALKALPEYELTAICTAHEDTAREAARAFGAEYAYHDPGEMFANPEVRLAVVSVRVPYHREITLSALNAGKDVHCEWPLGANLAEAEEMTALAHSKGARTIVGLQGRSDPVNMYVRELVQQGWLGDVVACNLTSFSGGILDRPSDRLWNADPANGANTMTIQGGHAIDVLRNSVADIEEVSAHVATQVPQWRTDTGEMVDTKSPDNVLVSARLDNGAVASIHIAGVPFNGSGSRLEIYGREGTLVILSPSIHAGPNRLMGAKGSDPLVEMPVPERFVIAPEGTPQGSPFNVAQAYVRFVEDDAPPTFEDALKLHRVLDAIQRSSNEGRRVRL